MIGGPRIALAAHKPLYFSPPSQPMKFTRTLVRQLGNGETITVKRSWKVQFFQESGYIIRGEQIAVAVTAPDALAPFKKMEEAKTESGVFPLRLDTAGLIASQHTPDHQQAVQDAIDHAKDVVARLGSAAAGQNTAQFLATIQQASMQSMSHLPRDLFFPVKLETNEQRELPLPDGTTGRISASFRAEMSGTFGIFEQAQRSITTTIGDQSRMSSESWSLLPV